MNEEITSPRLIPLRAKYLTNAKGRFKGGDTSAPKKPKRRKLSDKQKATLPAQPKVVLHVFADGRQRFERVA